MAHYAPGVSNVRHVENLGHSDKSQPRFRGRAAVSPDETKLAVTNLFDGVDLYSLADQSRLGSIPVDMGENFPTAVSFASNSSIIFGGGSGCAYVAEGTPLTVQHNLEHGSA